MTFNLATDKYIQATQRHVFSKTYGKVSEVVGLVIKVVGLETFIGEICEVHLTANNKVALTEVVGFVKNTVLLMPLDELDGISPGCLVVPTKQALSIKIGEGLLGHTLDGLGRPLDDLEITADFKDYPVMRDAPDPFKRPPIREVLPTGVRAIDGLLTVGNGQRIGIFAGSGVGKSTLLGMMAKYADADVIVIGLIGERGREVREFIEKDLGPDGYKKAVIVCATSDMPPLVRLKGAYVATAIAEYFRDQGKRVILMMDSVTRFAMAQREIGLSTGEPPTTRGYTPSVFALLPKLLERSGPAEKGSITAFYTVLVEGDDMNEPIADAVRGILDGHILLSRKIAGQNHYPAIDVQSSLSRLMNSLVTQEHGLAANKLRESMATYTNTKDLIDIGAYQLGTNQVVDQAINLHQPIDQWLVQSVDEHANFEETTAKLKQLFQNTGMI